MTLHENKRVVRRFYEEFVSTGNVEQLHEVISPGYRETLDVTGKLRGIDAAQQHVLGVRQTFPDLQITVGRQIAEGDWVVTEVTARGTHRGSWMDIAPTGKRLQIHGVNVDRVENGRITEHGGAANMLEPLLEIGAIRKVTAQDSTGA